MATALASYTKQVAAAGNTTLHEPGTIKPEWVQPLAKLSNTLDVRMSASLSTEFGRGQQGLHVAWARRQGKEDSLQPFFALWHEILGRRLEPGRNRGADQTLPAHHQEQARANYSESQMAEMCLAAKKAGWPILIHCQGDAAIDDALDAIEQAYGPNPVTGLNRVEHATMARQDQTRPNEAARRGAYFPSRPSYIYMARPIATRS